MTIEETAKLEQDELWKIVSKMSEKEITEYLELNELAKVFKAKENMEFFIENFVHIEDRDSAEIAVLFKLWEGQKKTLRDFENHRLNIALKARQLGITWLALAYSAYNLLFKKGYQVVALSRTEDDAKELVRRLAFILRYMPKQLITDDKMSKGTWYESTATSVTIHHPDGESSVFNSFPASANSGRSFTANLVIIDEWAFQQFAREIWTAAYPTINRPSGGKVIGISTAKRMTLFEEIWKKAKAGHNTFNTIFLPWSTDPRRTPEWYEQTIKDLGEHNTKVEYPNTPEEAFDVSEGSAFPEFSYDIHVCKPFDIPAHWARWRSGDNGYTDPFAFYWFAVSEDGQVFVYREYTRDPKDPRIIYKDQAKEVVRLTGREEIGRTILGHDAWNTHHRDESGKQLVDYYREGGLVGCVKAVTDRAIRKATWHEYLKPYKDNTGKYTAKVQIFDTCYKIIETLPQLLNDENDNEKVMECKFDHFYDGCGYGLVARHSTGSDKPQEEAKNGFFREKEDKTKENGFCFEVDQSFFDYGGVE